MKGSSAFRFLASDFLSDMQGNIIVTDNKYKIITLLRSYQTEDGVTVAVGETYPIDKYQTYPHVDAAAIEEILSSSPDSTIKDALAKKIGMSYSIFQQHTTSA
mgnify:CR=1 FL=1